MPVAAYSVFTGGASAGHALTASPSYILTQAAWCAAVRDYFVALNAVDDFVAAYAIDYSLAVTALRAPWVLALAKARQGRSRLKGSRSARRLVCYHHPSTAGSLLPGRIPAASDHRRAYAQVFWRRAPT